MIFLLSATYVQNLPKYVETFVTVALRVTRIQAQSTRDRAQIGCDLHDDFCVLCPLT